MQVSRSSILAVVMAVALLFTMGLPVELNAAVAESASFESQNKYKNRGQKRKRYRRTWDGRCYWRNPAGRRVYVSRTLCNKRYRKAKKRKRSKRKYRRTRSGRCYYRTSSGQRIYVPRRLCRK